MELPLKALLGDYGDRLAKSYGGEYTISDANLREKLTVDEYKELCHKYDYLVPVELEPEPPLLEDEDFVVTSDGVDHTEPILIEDEEPSPLVFLEAEVPEVEDKPKTNKRKNAN